MATYQYETTGTCSKLIKFTIDDDKKVRNVSFMGGCNGNLKGISRLVEGQDADWVADTLQGTQCGMKSTSCPDQLACALRQALQSEQSEEQ